MKKPLWFALILFALNFNSVAAWAQSGSTIVTNCGTLGQAYTAGSNRPPTANTNGVACADTPTGGVLDTDLKAPPTLGSASGGWTPVGKTAITNSSVTVKNAPGQLAFALCDNNNAAWTYLQMFDATSPSIGTNVGFIALPPSLSGGFTQSIVGLQFSNSIKVAATTTPGGSSAPATNTVNCTFGYN